MGNTISELTPITALVAAVIIVLIIIFFLWLLNSRDTIFLGEISAAQEVPAPTLPPGVAPRGEVNASLNKDQNSLAFSSNVTGTSGPITAVHFHRGATGVAGPIVKTLNFRQQNGIWISDGAWSSTDQVEPLTPVLVQDLLNNRIYINWHTALNPNGEVRGQVFNGSA